LYVRVFVLCTRFVCKIKLPWQQVIIIEKRLRVEAAPQFCSSDISPQSLLPSQMWLSGMQRPVFSHWNWLGPHVASPTPSAYDKHTLLCHELDTRLILFISAIYKLTKEKRYERRNVSFCSVIGHEKVFCQIP